MLRYLAVFIFLVAAASCPRKSFSQEIERKSKTLTAVIDTAGRPVRAFSEPELRKYRSDKAFDYRETSQTPSLWDRFWNWFWSKIGNLFGNAKVPAPFFKYAMIIAAIAFIIYAAVKLSGMDLASFIRGKSKEAALPYAEAADDIHIINFDEEIDRALGSRNYRLAVRLLYLHALKQLNDHQLIRWQPEKTNMAYLNEIGDAERKSLFGKLTGQFEYVWYGDFPVNGERFEQIRAAFREFNKQLQ